MTGVVRRDDSQGGQMGKAGLMRLRSVAALMLALAFSGCGQGGDASAPGGGALSDSVASSEVLDVPVTRVAPSPPQQIAREPLRSEPPLPPTTQIAMLAYSYQVGIEAPAAQVAGLARQHQQACPAAGVKLCQVIEADVRSQSEDFVAARLQLRAEPKWLEAFRAKLEGDAKAADGKLIASSVSTEDLTRQIVDSEAVLRSRKALRVRLEELLRSRPGKLGDLLETERELARVQGEIDSMESALAVMRGRVAMSELTVNYQTAPSAVSQSAFEPLLVALRDFVRLAAQSLAAMISFLAVALPWLVLAGGVLWLWLRRRRLRKAAASRPSGA
jgi:hypothetical protein